MGKFNISNILAAFGVLEYLGVPQGQILRSLSSFSSVAGRMESVPNTKGLNIFIDYAHTEASLRSVI